MSQLAELIRAYATLLTAVAAIVSAGAWPTVVAVVVWTYREEIRAKFPSLTELGPGGGKWNPETTRKASKGLKAGTEVNRAAKGAVDAGTQEVPQLADLVARLRQLQARTRTRELTRAAKPRRPPGAR